MPHRPDEEKANIFLKMIKRSMRGHLKIYLGYCAGVGKTYRMLQEAQTLKKEGIDVVVGFVETYGRAETEKLLEGLEIIPRKVFEYRGIIVEEMDVDAVIRRKPEVALIDELAHTNVPGSRNEKRYQDIREVLATGIHVITTLNIQHMESLFDTVEKAINVKVRERVPDTVISDADQIVNVDVSTEDLIKRLGEGKIYPKEKVGIALDNFFIPANLEKLRELTLRELAAQIDIRSREPEHDESLAIADQVMVCLSSKGPNSEQLLRYASRFAGRLNKNWYALYVQRELEDPLRIDPQTLNALSNTLTLAKQLGAIVFTYKGEDIADTILRFAKEYRVGHIIIGTPKKLPFYQRIFYEKNLMERLVQEAKDINIIVVDTAKRKASKEVKIEYVKKPDETQKLSLSNLLTIKNIIIWKDDVFKDEVLSGLVKAVCNDSETCEKIYKALVQREEESTTFFNEGVAFPHLRMEGEFEPKIALGIVQKEIIDVSTTKPIQFVFLVLSPANHPEIQAQLLALASKIARNDNLMKIIRAAKDPRTILEELQDY